MLTNIRLVFLLAVMSGVCVPGHSQTTAGPTPPERRLDSSDANKFSNNSPRSDPKVQGQFTGFLSAEPSLPQNRQIPALDSLSSTSPIERWAVHSDANLSTTLSAIHRSKTRVRQSGFQTFVPKNQTDWDNLFVESYVNRCLKASEYVVTQFTTATLSDQEIIDRFVVMHGQELAQSMDVERARLNKHLPDIRAYLSPDNSLKDPEAYYRSKPELARRVANLVEWRELIYRYGSEQKISRAQNGYLSNLDSFIKTMGPPKSWGTNTNFRVESILRQRNPDFSSLLTDEKLISAYKASVSRDPNYREVPLDAKALAAIRERFLDQAKFAIVVPRILENTVFDSPGTRDLIVQHVQARMEQVTVYPLSKELFQPEIDILNRIAKKSQ